MDSVNPVPGSTPTNEPNNVVVDENTIEIDDDWSLVLGTDSNESSVNGDVESIALDAFEGDDQSQPETEKSESQSVAVPNDAQVGTTATTSKDSGDSAKGTGVELIYKPPTELVAEVPSSFMEGDEEEMNLVIDEGDEEENLPEITIAANLFNQEEDKEEDRGEAMDQNEGLHNLPATPAESITIEEFTNYGQNGVDESIVNEIQIEGKTKFNWLWHGLTKENDLLVRNVEESEGRFVCAMCYFSSNDKSDLETHVQTHLTNSRYLKCKICDKKFVFKFLLSRHMTTHQNEDGENFPTSVRAALRAYQSRVPPAPPLGPPPLTPAGWLDQKERLNKIIKETSVYDCIHCSAKFNSAPLLQKHEDVAHYTKTCKLCGAEQLTFQKMKRHLIRDHKISALTRFNLKVNATNLWIYVNNIKKRECEFFLKNINEFHTYSRRPDPVQLRIIANIESRLKKLEMERERNEVDQESNEPTIESTSQQGDNQTLPTKPEDKCENDESIVHEQLQIIPIDPEIFVALNVEIDSTKPRFGEHVRTPPCRVSPKRQERPATHTKRKHNPSHQDLPRDTNMEIEFPSLKSEGIEIDLLSNEILDDRSEDGEDVGENERELFPHICDYCGKGFTRILALKHHEKLHLTGKYSFNLKCHICVRKFTTPYNLKRHMSTCHSEVQSKSVAKCPLCMKVFPNAGSLAVHSNCHALERQYKCEHCDRAYNYASLLKRHMRIHSGDKPYTCSVCGLKFHELVSLKYHVKKIHTLERPHRCEACQKSFILKSDLKKHLITHMRMANDPAHAFDLLTSTDPFDNGNVYVHVPNSGFEGEDPNISASAPRKLVLKRLVGADKSQFFKNI